MCNDLTEVRNKNFKHEYHREVVHARGREHCRSHKKYYSLKEVKKYFDAIRQIVPGRKMYYYCKYCHWFHITDKPENEEIQAYNNQPYTDDYQINTDWEDRCKGKHRYASRLAAQTFLNILGDREMVVYPCQTCGTWHIGHRWYDATKETIRT